MQFSFWLGRVCELMVNPRAIANEVRHNSFCRTVEIKSSTD